MKRIALLLLSATLLAAPALAGSGRKAAKKAKPKVPAAQQATASEDRAPALGKHKTGELREKKYFYSSFGTRDPFMSLVGGNFEPKLQDLVDVHTVELVGVLWEDQEFVAMVQDGQGFGYNLRPGDRVRNGTVVSVSKDAMVARLNVFGQTTRITLRLQREE